MIAFVIFLILFAAFIAWLFLRSDSAASRPARLTLFRPVKKTGLKNFDHATRHAPHDLQAHASLVRLVGIDKAEKLISAQQASGHPRAQATRLALDNLLNRDKSHKGSR